MFQKRNEWHKAVRVYMCICHALCISVFVFINILNYYWYILKFSLILSSAVKWLIAINRIQKVFVCIIYTCFGYIYYVYINTHTYSIYFVYIYIHIMRVSLYK